MASVRKTTLSPYWQAVITLEDGSRTNRSTKQTEKKKAQEVADEMERTHRAARDGRLAEGQLLKTFNELVARVGADTMSEETVEEYLRRWLKGKDNPSTAERYGKTVELFLASIGNKAQGRLTVVSHKDVLKFMDERKAEGLAPKTILVDVKSLNNAFNIARRTNMIQANPVEHALAIAPLKTESSTKNDFMDEDVTKLLKVATGDWKTMVLLGYYCGGRIGDCANMTWGNVKEANGVALLDYIEEKTKGRKQSADRVVVPIHPQLKAHLDTLPKFAADTPFCPTLRGKETGGAHGLSKSFQKLMADARVDCQQVKGKGKRMFSRVSFHSFRHTFNSRLANGGVSQETRMALTGHTTESINTGYTHLDLGKLASAIQTLPALKTA